jgi:predicted RNase H-like HicB family nuclease
MERRFTLEYWMDDDWYVGRIKEVPGVFSQGATSKELEQNVVDAYRMVTADHG